MMFKSRKNAGQSPKNTNITGMGNHMLIPVDFSDASIISIRIGFHIASRLGILPVLMHVYPLIWNNPLTDLNPAGINNPFENEMLDVQEEKDLHEISSEKFKKLKEQIQSEIRSGLLPDIKFTTLLEEGVPEEEILEYCKNNTPRLVLMTTRGVDRKEVDLIGSVTAEVLDSCRVPVFTIPDNFTGNPAAEFKEILLICSPEEFETEYLDKLLSLFNTTDEHISIMPLIENRELKPQRIREIEKFLYSKWPDIKLQILKSEKSNVVDGLETLVNVLGIELIIAPNRKTSIFARLFHPSLAHQCLFAMDIPMLALPVHK